MWGRVEECPLSVEPIAFTKARQDAWSDFPLPMACINLAFEVSWRNSAFESEFGSITDLADWLQPSSLPKPKRLPTKTSQSLTLYPVMTQDERALEIRTFVVNKESTLWTVLDRTAEFLVEQAMEEVHDRLVTRETMLRALFDSVSQGLFVQDASGHLVSVNATLAAILDSSLAALKGASLDQFFVETLTGADEPDDPPEMQREIWRTQAGRSIPVHVMRFDYEDEAGQSLTLGLVSDVTAMLETSERHRLVTQLLEDRVAERTTQVNSLSKQLLDMSSMLVHDLRGPMSSIVTLARYLKRKPVDEYQDKLVDYWSTVEVNGQRQLELMEELVAYLTLESDWTTGQARDFDPMPILREMGLLYHVDIREKEINLTVTESTVPVKISGLTTTFGRIVDNLLRNAVKYARSQIDVDASASTTDRLIIEIRDDGTGIPEEVIARLFERKERPGPKQRQSLLQSHGLGLPAVKHMVTQFAGEVSHRSLETGGSSFRIEIPATGQDLHSS